MSTIEKLQRCVEQVIAVPLEKPLSVEQSFTDDLNLDSIDLVELLIFIEEDFGLEIPDSAAEGMTTVKHAVDYLDSRLNSDGN